MAPGRLNFGKSYRRSCGTTLANFRFMPVVDDTHTHPKERPHSMHSELRHSSEESELLIQKTTQENCGIANHVRCLCPCAAFDQPSCQLVCNTASQMAKTTKIRACVHAQTRTHIHTSVAASYLPEKRHCAGVPRLFLPSHTSTHSTSLLGKGNAPTQEINL